MIANRVMKEGEWLSLNGSTGEVIFGKQPLAPPGLSRNLETFMSWADEIRSLKVVFTLDVELYSAFEYIRVNGIDVTFFFCEGYGKC